MDRAINETLSRTVMTALMTLLVVVALMIVGGPVLRGFSVALFVGILIGTYSSIFIASATALSLGVTRENLLPKPPPEAVDDRP
jgi:preprotein translocase subunit SecF